MTPRLYGTIELAGGVIEAATQGDDSAIFRIECDKSALHGRYLNEQRATLSGGQRVDDVATADNFASSLRRRTDTAANTRLAGPQQALLPVNLAVFTIFRVDLHRACGYARDDRRHEAASPRNIHQGLAPAVFIAGLHTTRHGSAPAMATVILEQRGAQSDIRGALQSRIHGGRYAVSVGV